MLSFSNEEFLFEAFFRKEEPLYYIKDGKVIAKKSKDNPKEFEVTPKMVEEYSKKNGSSFKDIAKVAGRTGASYLGYGLPIGALSGLLSFALGADLDTVKGVSTATGIAGGIYGSGKSFSNMVVNKMNDVIRDRIKNSKK